LPCTRGSRAVARISLKCKKKNPGIIGFHVCRQGANQLPASCDFSTFIGLPPENLLLWYRSALEEYKTGSCDTILPVMSIHYNADGCGHEN
jgi:hypothetical protein